MADQRTCTRGTNRLAAIAFGLALVVAGCGSSSPSSTAAGGSQAAATSGGSSSAPSASAGATPGAGPSGAPSIAPLPSAAVSPSAATTAVACELPSVMPGTTDRAQLTAVRIGSHDGYDRVVFEFAGGGTPGVELAAVQPPFVHDASGLPLHVDGAAFVRIVLRGASGAGTYGGPTAFSPHDPQLRTLVEAGDYEMVNSWIAGLESPACPRVSLLTDPTRVVVDFPHG
jgi:hypothetical protein